MSQSSSDIPLTKAAFRNWMRVRMQELKRTDPTLSKKNYWRIANKEWLEAAAAAETGNARGR